MIDDSALFHGTYDPVKAREYYLRTRKLKGRTKAEVAAKGVARAAIKKPAVKVVGQKPNRANTKSRREELKAQRAALQKRLDHLRDVLKKKVEEAKKTSHKNAAKHPAKKDDKATAPETPADVADRNRNEKKQRLTASQKSAKAKAAKKAYEKEHPNTLSDDIDILREQIKDIKAKIEKVMADAKEQKNKANKPKPLARR